MNLHWSKGEYSEAEEYLAKALNKIPGAPNWIYHRGLLELRREDYASSERDLLSAYQLSNEQGLFDMRILTGWVVALQHREKSTEALTLQNLAEQKGAGDFWTWMTYQNHFLQNWESTLNAGQRALEYDDRQRYVLQHMAEANMSLDKVGEAISSYKKILEFQPRNGRIWLALGKVYAQVGRREDATSTLKHALDGKMLSRVEEKEVKNLLAELKVRSS